MSCSFNNPAGQGGCSFNNPAGPTGCRFNNPAGQGGCRFPIGRYCLSSYRSPSTTWQPCSPIHNGGKKLSISYFYRKNPKPPANRAFSRLCFTVRMKHCFCPQLIDTKGRGTACLVYSESDHVCPKRRTKFTVAVLQRGFPSCPPQRCVRQRR